MEITELKKQLMRVGADFERAIDLFERSEMEYAYQEFYKAQTALQKVINTMPPNMEDSAQVDYLECIGLRCPFCNSPDISAEEFTAEGEEGFQEVTCGVCGEIWQDQYLLIGFIS